ncbi:PDZ domain-containing protein [Lysobacter xanthus]
MNQNLRSFVLVALLVATPAVFAAQAPAGLSVELHSSGVPSAVVRAATVARVQPDSAAARAGLRAGDRIVEIDGRPLRTAGARPIATALRSTAEGRHVTLGIERDDGRIDVALLAAR